LFLRENKVTNRVTALALVSVALAGCADSSDIDGKEAQAVQRIFDVARWTPEVMEKWNRSCALCHVGGEGGAPGMADSVAWQGRIAGGNARLLKNTLEGLNRMPPLGYCMDCDEQDFAAMIEMMAGLEQ
jgi:cytochrome c5